MTLGLYSHKNPTIPAVFCHGAIPVIPVVDENIKAWSFLGNLGSDPPHWWPRIGCWAMKIPTQDDFSEFFAPPIRTKIVERKSSSVKKWEWLHLPPKFSGVTIIIYLSCHHLVLGFGDPNLNSSFTTVVTIGGVDPIHWKTQSTDEAKKNGSFRSLCWKGSFLTKKIDENWRKWMG